MNPGFRADIQGLRAIAVGAVLLFHAEVPGFSGGFVGVDVFFVISGFLITGHLVRERELHGRVAFGKFYARRARRLLPAALTVLVVTLVVALLTMPPLAISELLQDALATALYVPNLLFAVRGTDYLASESPSVFQHYWSLGVEEQFYLIWPVLVLLALSSSKAHARVGFVVGVVGALSFALCIGLTTTAQPWAFFGLPTRAWEFAIGGGVALLGGRVGSDRPWLNLSVSWTALLTLVGCMAFLHSSVPFPGWIAAIPVLATSALIAFGRSPAGDKLAMPFLASAPLQFVGMISYSLYLVHWPLLVLVEPYAPESVRPAVRVGLMIVAVPIAYIVYRWVERPFQERRSTASAHRTLMGALASTTGIVIMIGALIPLTSAIPLYGGPAAASADIRAQPDGGADVPMNLRPSLRSASSDVPTVYELGCHQDFGSSDARACEFGEGSGPVVAIFGDSHAAQWVPAIAGQAERTGARLFSFTKSSCPSVYVPVFRHGMEYSTCSDWRKNVIVALEELRPEIVIVANSTRYSEDELPSGIAGWVSGTAQVIDELEQLGSELVFLEDTPSFESSPPVCLSQNLTRATRCGAERAAALETPLRLRRDELEAVIGDRGRVVDLNDLICSTFCPAIIGNTLVYRDSNHLTATFAASLGGEVVNRIGILPVTDQERTHEFAATDAD